jgi:hypothetical protein
LGLQNGLELKQEKVRTGICFDCQPFTHYRFCVDLGYDLENIYKNDEDEERLNKMSDLLRSTELEDRREKAKQKEEIYSAIKKNQAVKEVENEYESKDESDSSNESV